MGVVGWGWRRRGDTAGYVEGEERERREGGSAEVCGVLGAVFGFVSRKEDKRSRGDGDAVGGVLVGTKVDRCYQIWYVIYMRFVITTNAKCFLHHAAGVKNKRFQEYKEQTVHYNESVN